MKEALGLVEIVGLSTAILVADTMAKTANVSIIEVENTKGQGFMTVKVIGDVGAVNAAVNSGKMVGLNNGKLVSTKVIPRPSQDIEDFFCNIDKVKKEEPPKKKTRTSVKTSKTSSEVKTDPVTEPNVSTETENAADKPTTKPKQKKTVSTSAKKDDENNNPL